MATLVLGAVGTLVGGPIGGALGALVGRQVDGLIIGTPDREGPRLKELNATTSSYGTPIPRHFGRMRVSGSIIWSTELVERSETEGGGKNRPSVTTYSYTASFAVALSSRPIGRIGRIWADGNLLRGEAGDLKAPGTLRVYTGEGDQMPDPLIASIEGQDRCPAYRGLAYVVFEDLELGDFFNRIPALTFEVFADDDPLSLDKLVGEVVPRTEAAVPLGGVAGFSCEGPLSGTLAALEPACPFNASATGDTLQLRDGSVQGVAIILPEPAIAVGDDDFGGASGFLRKRAEEPATPPEILRYYDVDRDYLPGVQRAPIAQRSGQPRTVEIPAVLTSANARDIALRMSRRLDWSRSRISWRTTDLDPSLSPGSIVRLPGEKGTWRIAEWEWREKGVELQLTRVLPASAEAAPPVPTDPGRANLPDDLTVPETRLSAFEMPWDGTGAGSTPAVFAAVSSSEAGWKGAALYADRGDGELHSLGSSGRRRAIVGTTENALPALSPLILDRSTSLVVTLASADFVLSDAAPRQLAAGANLALVGKEIIQFATATALGVSRWKLSGLLRGRGGTEAGAISHLAGETFVLLDEKPVSVDPAIVGAQPYATLVAIGPGDAGPVTSAIALRGVTLRPLRPVHPRAEPLAGGGLRLTWARRARGAWEWTDGVDVPLAETRESYIVGYGEPSAPAAAWTVDVPRLELDPQSAAEGLAQGFFVKQVGTYAQSGPTLFPA